MQILDDCLTKTRRMRELDEQITELRARATAPKNQVITGMPRGSAGGNQSESYMVKLERLEAARAKARKERAVLWCECVAALNQKNVKPEYITLLRYRFFKGLQWRKCCAMMCEDHPESNWNMNKIFRVYRQILRKFS